MPTPDKAIFSIWYNPDAQLGTVVFSVNLEERGEPPIGKSKFMGNITVDGESLNGEFSSPEVDEARNIAKAQLRTLGAKHIDFVE
jgi:hypothetical protein